MLSRRSCLSLVSKRVVSLERKGPPAVPFAALSVRPSSLRDRHNTSLHLVRRRQARTGAAPCLGEPPRWGEEGRGPLSRRGRRDEHPSSPAPSPPSHPLPGTTASRRRCGPGCCRGRARAVGVETDRAPSARPPSPPGTSWRGEGRRCGGRGRPGQARRWRGPSSSEF